MLLPAEFAINGVLKGVVMVPAVGVELKRVRAKLDDSIMEGVTTFYFRGFHLH
jgi:hypothetical protein